MKITKKLFDYLNWFDFVDDWEIFWAIIDYFFRNEPCYYSDLARASEIADTYKAYMKLKKEWWEIDRHIIIYE